MTLEYKVTLAAEEAGISLGSSEPIFCAGLTAAIDILGSLKAKGFGWKFWISAGLVVAIEALKILRKLKCGY